MAVAALAAGAAAVFRSRCVITFPQQPSASVSPTLVRGHDVWASLGSQRDFRSSSRRSPQNPFRLWIFHELKTCTRGGIPGAAIVGEDAFLVNTVQFGTRSVLATTKKHDPCAGPCACHKTPSMNRRF